MKPTKDKILSLLKTVHLKGEKLDIISNNSVINTFFPNQHISVVDKTEETEDIASSDVTEAAILEKRQDLISQRAVRR